MSPSRLSIGAAGASNLFCPGRPTDIPHARGRISIKRWVFILATVSILVANSAKAQTNKHGPMAKLTHSLVLLHEQHAARLAQRSAAPFSSDDPLISLVNDRVVVDAVASGDVNVLKSDLVALGMQHAVAFGRVVSGQLPISAIPAAAGLASLRFAQSAAATTHVGSVTSQGDHAMRSDVARTKFGVDGSGINVGALSDSFNCLGGAAADASSGDLPSVTVIQEISVCTGATDEGRAILQVVHDVAPGASLSFASAFNGQASFASNIRCPCGKRRESRHRRRSLLRRAHVSGRHHRPGG